MYAFEKRSLDDEEIFVSFKHPRQVGHHKELMSFSESVFPGDVSKQPETLENGWAKDNRSEEISDDKFSGLPKGGEDVETSAPRSFAISSWTTSSTGGEGSLFEASFHGFFFPEYFNHERPVRTLTQSNGSLPPMEIVGYYFNVLEPYDAKIWDAGYMTFPQNKVDFLPTCNMIEEVFGERIVDLQIKGWQKLGLVLHVLCRDGFRKSVFRCSYSRGPPESLSSETILLELSFRRVFLVYIRFLWRWKLAVPVTW